MDFRSPGLDEVVDRLSRLTSIFDGIDLRADRTDGDNLLGDAYEYLMRYIDASELEDLHDLDALQDYWQVFSPLRQTFLSSLRHGE